MVQVAHSMPATATTTAASTRAPPFPACTAAAATGLPRVVMEAATIPAAGAALRGAPLAVGCWTVILAPVRGGRNRPPGVPGLLLRGHILAVRFRVGVHHLRGCGGGGRRACAGLSRELGGAVCACIESLAPRWLRGCWRRDKVCAALLLLLLHGSDSCGVPDRRERCKSCLLYTSPSPRD